MTTSNGHWLPSIILLHVTFSPATSRETNPENNDLGAEPEPSKASSIICCSESSSSKASLRAITKEAIPDADDANPAAVGKLLPDSIKQESRTLLIFFNSSKGILIRSSDDCLDPFNIQVSSLRSLGNEILVFDSKISIVIEIELIAGILPTVLDLPQYLIKAIFGCAMAVDDFTSIILFVNHKFNASSIL